MSHQLQPVKLEQLGLVATIGWMCHDVSGQEGIRPTFSHEGIPKSLPREIALSVFRIAQEAIQNMVKHCGARKGKVSIRREGMSLLLDVSDKGRGSLSVESQGSRGTWLKIRVPVRSPSPGGQSPAPPEAPFINFIPRTRRDRKSCFSATPA